MKEFNGKLAETPRECASNSEFIFSCVGNDDDLREVTTGVNGAFQNIKPGVVFIDNTTASAKVARELFNIAKEKKFGFLDAPVSGGQAGAENGALTVMINGVWRRQKFKRKEILQKSNYLKYLNIFLSLLEVPLFDQQLL